MRLIKISIASQTRTFKDGKNYSWVLPRNTDGHILNNILANHMQQFYKQDNIMDKLDFHGNVSLNIRISIDKISHFNRLKEKREHLNWCRKIIW